MKKAIVKVTLRPGTSRCTVMRRMKVKAILFYCCSMAQRRGRAYDENHSKSFREW